MLKKLVSIMSTAGLSAKTIKNYLDVPKAVVASVMDDDGNQVYPRKWNNDFIDIPVVEPSEQNRPSFSPEIIPGLPGIATRASKCFSFSQAPQDSVSGRRLGLRLTSTCRPTVRRSASGKKPGAVVWRIG